MQRFADQECGLGHRIGGAVREHQLRLDEAADRIADEIEQRQQFAGGDLGALSMRRGRAWQPVSRASPSGFGPARGGSVIVIARLDPAGSGGAFLALPERRVGLQVVHQELRRLKRRLPVLRCRQHQHDIFAGDDAADAMNDASAPSTASATSRSRHVAQFQPPPCPDNVRASAPRWSRCLRCPGKCR